MKYVINPKEIFDEKVKINNANKIMHFLNDDNVIFDVNFKNIPYYDHFETTSCYSSNIIQYGVDANKNLYLKYHLVFPTFRKEINDTRGSFAISLEDIVNIFVNNDLIQEKVNKIIIDNLFNIKTYSNNIRINRCIYSSNRFPCSITKFVITNPTMENITVHLALEKNYLEIKENIANSIPYFLKIFFNDEKKEIYQELKVHESFECYLSIACYYKDDTLKLDEIGDYNRLQNIKGLVSTYYYVNTPNKVINELALKCKLRCTETIFNTKNGLMHSPCGGQYYAGIWTNDQLEYTAPFFSYLNYYSGNKAIENAFKMFGKYVYKTKPIVSSIVAEGDTFWNGALDRGDNEMYVYGLCFYLLCSGNESKAFKYVKKIQNAISYILKKKSKEGIIFSNTDELENRFESGSYNLATNSIAYGALKYASRLFSSLNIENDYLQETNKLKESIIKYFHKNNHYIYCKEETHLRAHIFYPLIMGIEDYKDDIIKDITNPLLLNASGLKIIDNNETIWDRATLMAIRAMFIAGYANKAYEILVKYSNNRLLGNHVPYAIEAYPEGNQAQLSAENALYERIFAEGILGFEPLTFTSFKLKLNMPDNLSYLEILNFYYAFATIHILVKKEIDLNHLLIGNKLNLFVENGQEIIIDLHKIF